MKIAALILALTTFIVACDKEEIYDDWGEAYPALSNDYDVPDSSGTPDQSGGVIPANPDSFSGTYDIIFFKREKNNECISYAKVALSEIKGCAVQKPLTPNAVRGKVVLRYDEATEGIHVMYKYDVLDSGDYYAINERTNNQMSYSYGENEFSKLIIGAPIQNGKNSLVIGNFSSADKEAILPFIKLITDDGSTIYTLALKKESDKSTLYDTRTPINKNSPLDDFPQGTPINLNPEDAESTASEINGKFDPFSIFGYYKITGMKIYKTEDYKTNFNNATPVYDTDKRDGTKFKGEFWITMPVGWFPQPEETMTLDVYIKYQIEQDLPEGIEKSILNPKLLQIKLPLQKKSGNENEIMNELFMRTFSLFTHWDKTWQDRTRKIVYRPRPKTFDGEDNAENLLYLGGNKEYAAVLTLEQIYAQEYMSTDNNKLNFNNTPYW